MIKSRRVRWVEHIAHMEDKKCRIFVGKPDREMENMGRDRRIILKCVLH
jgi:hypothetical protein